MAASDNASAIKPKKHGEAMKKKHAPNTAQSGKPVSAAAGTAAADREPLARVPCADLLCRFGYPPELLVSLGVSHSAECDQGLCPWTPQAFPSV